VYFEKKMGGLDFRRSVQNHPDINPMQLIQAAIKEKKRLEQFDFIIFQLEYYTCTMGLSQTVFHSRLYNA
jgi:hypothetical protein